MDNKQIRKQLRGSLELKTMWARLLILVIIVAIVGVIRGFCNYAYEPFWVATATIAAVTVTPYLIFCTLRTLMICRRAGDYIFCRVRLTNPHAGFLRDTIAFSVLVEDPRDQEKFFVDTHAIFSTRGFGLRMEEYNDTHVIVGYNRETHMVVVMG